MDNLDTKTGFKLFNLYRIILFLALVAILGACADVSTPKVNINGIVSKGPIGGATVIVYALNSDGTTGEILGTAITEADGSFAVEIEDYTGNVLVVSSEGQYTDEATGTTKENPGLRTALDNVKETNYVAVTALTEIAARRAEGAGGLITGNINEANAFITDMIGNIDIVSTRPADVLDPSSASATEDEKEYGLILAGMSQMVADAVFPNISAAITNISDDLTDDNLDQTGSDLVSAIDTFASSPYNETGLIENIINLPPIANAGADQNVTTWNVVTLDGSGSSDADNSTLTYSWTFASAPAGSSASLSDAIAANPTFTADMDGVYVFNLVVNDGTLNSTADLITVTAATANSAPMANAGLDQNVAMGSVVTLDGSGSSDADDDTLTYGWVLTSTPAGSSASLSDATAVNPTFTADLDGVYVLNLLVNDGTVNSTADTITVTAIDLIQGLVAYYPFNGNTNDESGNANNGSAIGPTLNTDRFGNVNSAYLFDGIDDYISIPDSSSLKTFSEMTVSAWIYVTGNEGQHRNIINKGFSDFSLKVSYHIPNALNLGLANDSAQGLSVGCFSNVELNRWYFTSFVYNGAFATCQVDGAESGMGQFSGNVRVSNTPVTIGNSNGASFFKGIIDDVRIYNRSLTDVEIQVLYNEGGALQ